MGMFDSIRFVCPSCGAFITVQCKSGPCSLRVYDAPQDQIPEEILKNLTSENPYYVCGLCGQEFALDVLPIVRVVKTLLLSPLGKDHIRFCSRRGATFTHDPDRKRKSVYVDPIFPYEMQESDVLEAVRILDSLESEDVKSSAVAHFDKEVTE